MLEIADGVMIARAAIGNPLIFKQILDYLKTGKYDKITDKQKIEQFKEYLDLAKNNEQIDLNRIKYLGGNFLRGLKQASKLRQELMKLKTFDQISDFVNKINI
jgi:tRNA-dihydrouridine synthase B